MMPGENKDRTFLAVQWLRLCTPKAGGAVSIPGQETRILHAVPRGQKKKKRKGNKDKVKLGEGLVDNLLLHSRHSWPTVPCPLPYRAAERLDT